MKNKFLLSIITLELLTLSLPLAASATPNPEVSTAEVLGAVARCSDRIPYVPVSVTCGTQTLSTLTGGTTGDLGKYSLTFSNASCVNGSPVSVSADVGGTIYNGSGTIGTYMFFFDKAWVDINTGTDCPTPGVPDLGVIQGAVAGLASAGGFLALRRRRKV